MSSTRSADTGGYVVPVADTVVLSVEVLLIIALKCGDAVILSSTTDITSVQSI